MNHELRRRKVLLMDGLGAFASAVFTGLILPLLSEWTKIPPFILVYLAIYALLCCFYSLGCYHFAKRVERWMVLAIILANFGYCVIVGALLWVLDDLTLLGWALLVGEIFVILGVISFEIKKSRS